MLHTINKSPYSYQCLVECLRVCAVDDTIVLIEDGVYAALAGSEWIKRLFEKTTAVYVLHSDTSARGLTNRIAPEIKAITYTHFVQLCVEQPNMLAWY